MHGLGSERTVILSTHILSEVESICSRVMIMNRGRVLAVDSPARLEEHLRPYREFAADVVGPRDAVLLALRAVPHVVQVVPDGDAGAARERALHDPLRPRLRRPPRDRRARSSAAASGCSSSSRW